MVGVRCGADELNHSGSDNFSVVEILVGSYHDGAFCGGVLIRVAMAFADDDAVGRMDVDSGGWLDGRG